MRVLTSVSLVLSLGTGLGGCSGEKESQCAVVDSAHKVAPESSDQIQRRAMQVCGLTTSDLYMIRFDGMTPSVMDQIYDVPRDQVHQWLDDYRAAHEPDPEFMFWNVPEETRPSWTDLRYLALETVARSSDSSPLHLVSFVIIDFDADVVRFGSGPIMTADFEKLDSLPLQLGAADSLLSLLSDSTPSWQYPDIRAGDDFPVDMSWRIAVVTRDKSLYRFTSDSGYSFAPPGFPDVYAAFQALTSV